MNKKGCIEWFEWIRHTLDNEKVSECFRNKSKCSYSKMESIQTNELICKHFLIHFQQLLMTNSICRFRITSVFSQWCEWVQINIWINVESVMQNDADDAIKTVDRKYVYSSCKFMKCEWKLFMRTENFIVWWMCRVFLCRKFSVSATLLKFCSCTF